MFSKQHQFPFLTNCRIALTNAPKFELFHDAVVEVHGAIAMNRIEREAANSGRIPYGAIQIFAADCHGRAKIDRYVMGEEFVFDTAEELIGHFTRPIQNVYGSSTVRASGHSQVTIER